ncbi:MAG TPA: hypothetical protein VJW20_12680 [Candidatus Angelobacter sp.]|nr:hypothetical protein [Candidatus Angelobacter sp.]
MKLNVVRTVRDRAIEIFRSTFTFNKLGIDYNNGSRLSRHVSQYAHQAHPRVIATGSSAEGGL